LTERLYYTDARLTNFRAVIRAVRDGGRRVYLDRTAFYPASGGQPNDLGTLSGVDIVDVVDEEDEVAHLIAAPVTATEVEGAIDWARRFDHMQQHTGQHLLSAVFHEHLNIATLSFHMGDVVSTIELATPALTSAQLVEMERAANEIVFENRRVLVTFEDASEAAGLRKASERGGTLRIVTIEGLDRSACGGTHVSSTGEIGPVLLRGTEKVRGNLRLEFVCGARAVRRARADCDALTRIARVFSSSLDEAPDLAIAQQAKLAHADKQRRRLAGELALRRGRELYTGADRVHVARVAAIDDEVRQEAQGFTGNPGAIYIAVCENPPSVLLAASGDSGVHAGNALKPLLADAGGRGGGSVTTAQGSVPDVASLTTIVERLRTLL
jgi:alanyl-tRNA synthetase